MPASGGYFHSKVLRQEQFPIKQKRGSGLCQNLFPVHSTAGDRYFKNAFIRWPRSL